MMSPETKLKLAQESRDSQPMDYVHKLLKTAPEAFSQVLQLKGFAGGVPKTPKQPP